MASAQLRAFVDRTIQVPHSHPAVVPGWGEGALWWSPSGGPYVPRMAVPAVLEWELAFGPSVSTAELQAQGHEGAALQQTRGEMVAFQEEVAQHRLPAGEGSTVSRSPSQPLAARELAAPCLDRGGDRDYPSPICGTA